MAIRSKDIYKGRSKEKKRPLKYAALILALLIVVAISAFYLIKKTCVYDENGNAIITWKFVKSDEEDRNVPGIRENDEVYVPEGFEPTPEPLPSQTPVIDESIAPSVGQN